MTEKRDRNTFKLNFYYQVIIILWRGMFSWASKISRVFWSRNHLHKLYIVCIRYCGGWESVMCVCGHSVCSADAATRRYHILLDQRPVDTCAPRPRIWDVLRELRKSFFLGAGRMPIFLDTCGLRFLLDVPQEILIIYFISCLFHFYYLFISNSIPIPIMIMYNASNVRITENPLFENVMWVSRKNDVSNQCRTLHIYIYIYIYTLYKICLLVSINLCTCTVYVNVF